MGILEGYNLIFILVGFAILFFVIELAVRRGIDNSETNEMIKKLIREKDREDSKKNKN